MSYSIHIVPVSEWQSYLTVRVLQKTDCRSVAEAAYGEIAEQLRQRQLCPVHERVFASCDNYKEVMQARRQAFVTGSASGEEGRVTFVDGSPPFGTGLAGIIVNAIDKNIVNPVYYSKKRVGTEWQMDGLHYLMLQNVQDEAPADSPARSRVARSPLAAERGTETRAVFERALKLLEGRGMTYRDAVRTWCYLSNILDWYGEFNRVRREMYKSFGVLPVDKQPLQLPASTGIGAQNPQQKALALDLLAVRRSSGEPAAIERLSNARQKDAFSYGSDFSRGAVLRDVRPGVLQLSGTAAIDEAGRSMHPTDCTAQMEATLDKVSALLATKGVGLDDLAAATVFVKRPEYAELFYEVIERWKLQPFPAVCVVADVCRDDLLFELDGEVALK